VLGDQIETSALLVQQADSSSLGDRDLERLVEGIIKSIMEIQAKTLLVGHGLGSSCPPVHLWVCSLARYSSSRVLSRANRGGSSSSAVSLLNPLLSTGASESIGKVAPNLAGHGLCWPVTRIVWLARCKREQKTDKSYRGRIAPTGSGVCPCASCSGCLSQHPLAVAS